MTEQERAMATIDPAVALAITVAVNQAKESFSELLREELPKTRAVATCEAVHTAVDDRLTKVEKMQFWMVTTAIVLTLGLAFNLALVLLDK
jgi:hypothetical protein